MALSFQAAGLRGLGSAGKMEKDPILTEINKRIIKAFDSFDKDANQTVDVR